MADLPQESPPAPTLEPDALPVLLVADDDKNMRLMLSRMFEGAYRVVTAGDGAQTLEAVERDRPDVVLVDLLLPDATGVELLAPIHARDPELPVILLTGISKQSTAQEALAAGAFDYLVKPLDDFADLENALSRAVDWRRAARGRA
jgi:DNA-binding NtrC family response regulator